MTTYLGPWSAGDDGTVNNMNAMVTQFATSSDIPVTGREGVLFIASDTFRISVDSGSTMHDVINSVDIMLESFLYGGD